MANRPGGLSTHSTACARATTHETLNDQPKHEVATLEETRFNGLKRECGIHEINLADL